MFKRILMVLAMLGSLLAVGSVVTASPASAECDTEQYGELDDCRSVGQYWAANTPYLDFQIKCDSPLFPGDAVVHNVYEGWWSDANTSAAYCPGYREGVVAVKSPNGSRLLCENNFSNNFFWAGHANATWHNLGFPNGTSPDWACSIEYSGWRPMMKYAVR